VHDNSIDDDAGIRTLSWWFGETPTRSGWVVATRSDTIVDAMQERVAAEPDLRSFLRLRRGSARQCELAASAQLSLSRYRRLENGRASAVRLDALLRIAEALRLGEKERLEFVKLARPDLAFLLSTAGTPPLGSQWRSVHGLARRLEQAKGSRERARVGVEIVHASLGLETTAFVLELRRDGSREVVFRIGSPQNDAIPVPEALARGRFFEKTFGSTRLAYAPMSRNGRVFGALGIAYPLEGRLDPKCFAFLGTVAALLEASLNNRVEQPGD
jgi:transcriptional regulator with XRE-family HTH domain